MALLPLDEFKKAKSFLYEESRVARAAKAVGAIGLVIGAINSIVLRMMILPYEKEFFLY